VFLYRSALVMHRLRSHWLRPPLWVSGCRSQSTHSRSATGALRTPKDHRLVDCCAPMNEPARAGGERSSRSAHFIGVIRRSAW